MHNLIPTVVQNEGTSLPKNSHTLLEKCSSRGFISEMKVTCIPKFRFIFWLFILNAIFFSSLVVANKGAFRSEQ